MQDLHGTVPYSFYSPEHKWVHNWKKAKKIFLDYMKIQV